MDRKQRSSGCRREEVEKPAGASNSQVHRGPHPTRGPISGEAEQGAIRNALSSQVLRQYQYYHKPEGREEEV